jgi:hypothetical protein
MNYSIQKPNLNHGDMPSQLQRTHAFSIGLVVALVRWNRTQKFLRYNLLGLELRQKKLQEKFGLSGLHTGAFWDHYRAGPRAGRGLYRAVLTDRSRVTYAPWSKIPLDVNIKSRYHTVT